MKQLIKFFLVLAALVAQPMSAQYQMTLQNAVQTSPTVFQFDVYIVATGANINLTSYGMKFACNSTIANSGTLGIAYVAGSTALGFGVAGVITSVSGGVTYLEVASNPGAQTVSTTPLKVGTFQITNTVPFGATPAGLSWDFSNPFPTTVNINNVAATAPANHINALAPYRIVALNDILVNPTTYEFDVAIFRTDADFSLTSYQVCFTYNSAIANGGTLAFTYVAGSTTLTSCTPLAPMIVNDGGVSNFICGSNAGTQLVTVLPLTIGRFRMTNTVPFAPAPMNIAWDFAGTFVTQININNSNLTIPGNHLNLLGNTPLPVELVTFTGRNANDKVLLKWKTATEINNYGFDIERKSSAGDWAKIGFMPGYGNSNSPRDYSYTDNNTVSGKVQYRLKQLDIAGKAQYSDAIDVAVAPPSTFVLMQNSPNPFNPTTSIKYQLPVASLVTLTVYDLLGREVSSIVNEYQQPGSYAAVWNGMDSRGAAVSSGVYLYRLAAGNFIQTKKMNYIR